MKRFFFFQLNANSTQNLVRLVNFYFFILIILLCGDIYHNGNRFLLFIYLDSELCSQICSFVETCFDKIVKRGEDFQVGNLVLCLIALDFRDVLVF